MSMIAFLAGCVGFAVCAPLVGCLLAGVDRKVSARMQGRVGPPLLQPYYDVCKLLSKERAALNSSEGVLVGAALLFAVAAGGVFFAGGDVLLSIFAITLSGLLFIMAAYSSRSPYAEVGAARECLQVLAYEPMLILMAVTFYLVTGSFTVSDAFALDAPAVVFAWPALLGLLFVLTIKLRKSPFDLSMSHHAHQEIVRGVTTEMSGRTLALVEIMHWCENVLFLGWVGLFFLWGNPTSVAVAVLAALVTYVLEIAIDNNAARVKWQAMVAGAWVVALVLGGINIAALAIM